MNLSAYRRARTVCFGIAIAVFVLSIIVFVLGTSVITYSVYVSSANRMYRYTYAMQAYDECFTLYMSLAASSLFLAASITAFAKRAYSKAIMRFWYISALLSIIEFVSFFVVFELSTDNRDGHYSTTFLSYDLALIIVLLACALFVSIGASFPNKGINYVASNQKIIPDARLQNSDAVTELKKLKELKEESLLTEEEFNEKRKKCVDML